MKKVFRKLLACLLAFGFALTLVGCQGNNALSFTAGTYEAAAKGNNAEVKVSVEFTDSEIKSVQVIEHSETPGISDKAITDIPQNIVKSQSLGIDTISGATNTSKAIINAVADCVTQAGGDAEALRNKKVEVNKSTEQITKEADVVVIGGGGAGLSAAIMAAQNGSSVIVIESNPFFGGNTIRCGGAMMVADPEALKDVEMNPENLILIEQELNKDTEYDEVRQWQDNVRKDIEEYKANGDTYYYDSVDFNALQVFYRFSQSAIPARLHEMISRSREDLDWLIELGFPAADKGGYILGDNWPRWFKSTDPNDMLGTGYFRVFQENIDKLDVESIMDTTATKLVKNDEGRVTQVIAEAKDGTTYTLNAKQGVVVATGGFAGNSELVKKYSDGRWPEGFEKLPTDNDPAVDGSGIIMAEEMGAQMYDMGHLQILPVADPFTGQIETLVGNAQGLYVNMEGYRFVDETADRDTMTNAILKQTDQNLYIISDRFGSFLNEEEKNFAGLSADDLIAQGVLFRADTLEELAKQINIDPEVLVNTVNEFNADCKAGVPDKFGRVVFGTNIPGMDVSLNNGPYYACLRKPSRHITKGGILINEKAQVLDNNDVVIPGLYAAGEVTGGTGVAGVLNCVDTGRLAGNYVSQEAK